MATSLKSVSLLMLAILSSFPLLSQEVEPVQPATFAINDSLLHMQGFFISEVEEKPAERSMKYVYLNPESRTLFGKAFSHIEVYELPGDTAPYISSITYHFPFPDQESAEAFLVEEVPGELKNSEYQFSTNDPSILVYLKWDGEDMRICAIFTDPEGIEEAVEAMVAYSVSRPTK